MHSAAKSFKNTPYVALTGSGIKKKKEETLGLRLTLSRAAAVSVGAHSGLHFCEDKAEHHDKKQSKII